MISVLLDSSNTALTVGLLKNNQFLDAVSYEAWQEQSEHMIPELDALLNKHHFTREDIGDVIVSVGPGSYTGVRISLTIAKVIAVALHVPLYPVSSLRVLMNPEKPSVCLINARSNRSYIGVYEKGKTLLADQIMNNEDVKVYLNSHPEYAVCGETSYLGVEGEKNNLAKTMRFLKPFLTPCENALGLKPVYMKD